MRRKTVKVGSRESRLAVRQTELVMEAVRKADPKIETQLITMKTTGDRILNQALDKIGGKGLFVKELDKALMEGTIDLSVHSLKDMPMEIPNELPILACPFAEDRRDVLILRAGLTELPKAPVIGTGSRRRQLQAALLYPEAEFKGIRGNIHTRLKKLDAGEYDALILAAAGILRMGLGDRISRFFSVEEMIPAAGQGILAVQGRREDSWSFLELVHSRETYLAAQAERSFVRTLDGGCSSPVAACAVVENGLLLLRGLYFDEETGRMTTGTAEGKPEQAEEIGCRLAVKLRDGQQDKGENHHDKKTE